MIDIESLKTRDGRKFGVRITYEHEPPDGIDPLDDDSISETEAEYLFDNGYNVYSYKKGNVKELQRYELCQVCGFPTENCHCQDAWSPIDLSGGDLPDLMKYIGNFRDAKKAP